MMVVSAYRTEDYQRNLYNNKVRTSGKVYADDYSARAGHSEHQTGLAIALKAADFVTVSNKENALVSVICDLENGKYKL